ncbi:MAG: hypothetical protein WAQ98_27235 [Blastocatellia bacterium]
MDTQIDNTETMYEENSYSANSYLERDSKEVVEISFTVSKSEYKRIEAGTFYNNYDFTEDYIRDVVLNEIEADKQKHLKSKEGSKLKK